MPLSVEKSSVGIINLLPPEIHRLEGMQSISGVEVVSQSRSLSFGFLGLTDQAALGYLLPATNQGGHKPHELLLVYLNEQIRLMLVAGDNTYFQDRFLSEGKIVTDPFLYMIPHDPDGDGTFIKFTGERYTEDWREFNSINMVKDNNASHLLVPEGLSRRRVYRQSKVKLAVDGGGTLFLDTILGIWNSSV